MFKTLNKEMKTKGCTFSLFIILFSLFILFGCDLPNPFYVRVAAIEGVPASGTTGVPLALTGTVSPSFATNKNIEWSFVSAETAGASLSGNILSAATEGTIVVRAVVKNGVAEGYDYTQDFTIVFRKGSGPSLTDFSVSIDISGDEPGDSVTASPDTGKHGDTITLNYAVADIAHHNLLDFGGVTTPIASVDIAGSGTRTYVINSDDSSNGVITITAIFTHTDLEPDPIAFTDPAGHITKTYGDAPFINAITKAHQGSGAITYSSDTDVATVDSSGWVTILKVGSAIITAEKEADTVYAHATASYTLNINKAAGAAVSVPTVNDSPTTGSITVNAVSLQTATGQDIEYAISTTNSSAPESGWEINKTTFTGLIANTTYYVYARSVSNENYDAGTPSVSAGITTAALTYGIGLSAPGTHTFAAEEHGYTPSPLTVTVTNTGNQATGALTVALSGTNDSSFTLSTTSIGSIAAGGTDTFTVSPETGLSLGTYTATVTVSGGNGITANFSVSFTVHDITPPTLSAGSVIRMTNTEAHISFTTDEAGTAYYLVQNPGAAAPTSAQVRSNNELLHYGDVTSGANTSRRVVLTAGEKDIYVVVEDDAGNISEPLKITVEALGLIVRQDGVPIVGKLITITSGSSIVLTITDSYTTIIWSMNGTTQLPMNATTFTFNSVGKEVNKNYKVGLTAIKDGLAYSYEIEIRIEP